MMKPLSLILLAGVISLAGCATAPSDQSAQDNSVDQYRLAMTEAGQGQYDQALDKLRAISHSPDNDIDRDRAEVGIAYVLYKQGKYDEAEKAATAFIKDRPEAAQQVYVRYLRALIVFARGDKEYQQLMGNMNPGDVYPEDLRTAYAQFSDLLERYPESDYSEDAINKAELIRGQLARYELHIARAQLSEGNYQDALSRARYVDEYYPLPEFQLPAVKLMKQAYEALGNAAMATQMSERLMDFQPNDAMQSSIDTKKGPEVNPAPDNAYLIQVGTFASQSNALALKERIQAAGYEAFIESMPVDNKTMHVVKVGPLSGRMEADKLKDQLKKDLDLNGRVITQ
jgi:outer membrane protein assembly factor BamD